MKSVKAFHPFKIKTMRKKYKSNDGKSLFKVKQDNGAENPNEWGNEDIFLVYTHRNFTVERNGFEPKEIFEHTIENKNYSYKEHDVFVIYAYIHSGVSLSLSRGTDRFDTSSTGYILVDPKAFDFNLYRENNVEFAKKSDREITLINVQSLIDTWNTFLEGNVYVINQYSIKKCKCCKHEKKQFIDSCGSIYAKDENEIIMSIEDCFGKVVKTKIKKDVKKI